MHIMEPQTSPSEYVMSTSITIRMKYIHDIIQCGQILDTNIVFQEIETGPTFDLFFIEYILIIIFQVIINFVVNILF